MSSLSMEPTTHNPNKSVEITLPPADGVSSLHFSPKSNLLLATSWDKSVRIWEVNPQGASIAKASISHDQPVLCSAWKEDGTTVFSAGLDSQAKMWPLTGGTQALTVAKHDLPIKEIAWIPELNLLVTASWDKTLRYWDTRQAQPAHTQVLPHKVVSMDVRHPILAVATADKQVAIFDLKKPQVEFKRLSLPLVHLFRVVSVFPDKQGCLVGSIEGRVAIQHIEESLISKNFTFKCHRVGSDVYAVNSIQFHPVYGTFSTAGSDGSFSFWDKESKSRLKTMARSNQPISCTSFNYDGTLFSYAVSYEWSKGASGFKETNQNYILVHQLQEADVKPKPKTSLRR